ncbi:amino acid ABC transporter permease [Burkholderia sp. WAC0059]|uniref:amino acid ABC transporter permease n=1 Tax=Burkholderia sp. WAC0059 TaxID=2066022 RepID=UPI000C7EA153|nr:amino acid ABC transporter permease [Burkholderia sp. WAC0059]PLZ02916.1 amino acid ABC transporter permease [Burkholderia sp. WAC0059]
MGYRWDWAIFLQPVGTGEPSTYLGWIVSGLEATVGISLAGWIIALAVGVSMGIVRTLPGKALYWYSASYVALFRNIPLIVQFFLWFWVVPELLPGQLGSAIKHLPPTEAGVLASVVCLGLFTSARVCEQVRSGLQALPAGQRAAGLSLGLDLFQTYRYVLLPVAARNLVPPLTSEFLNIIKNSSVASTIGVLELSAQAQRMVDYTSQAYESFIAIIAGYALMTGLVMIVARRIEKSVRLATSSGGR